MIFFSIKHKRNLLICSCISAILVACSTDPVVTNKDTVEIPIALCLLCPEKNGVVAFIGRSFPEVGIEYLNDAQVTISYDSGYVQLYHISNGVYKNNDFQVQHNKEYKFSALLKSGKWLTATTKVPGTVKILNISNGDTLFYEKDPSISDRHVLVAKGPPISWKTTEGAAYYLCYYQFEEILLNQSQRAVTTSDTAISTLRLIYMETDGFGHEMPIIPIRRAKLVICALDSFFYMYSDGINFYSENFSGFRNPIDPRQITFPDYNFYNRSNIINGQGIFGSYTYDSVDIVVVLREY